MSFQRFKPWAVLEVVHSYTCPLTRMWKRDKLRVCNCGGAELEKELRASIKVMFLEHDVPAPGSLKTVLQNFLSSGKAK